MTLTDKNFAYLVYVTVHAAQYNCEDTSIDELGLH
jgi:hypothetical protein